MHPEITGDTDSPHLVYEYDGKPTVNVVILDTNGKRRCAHWSVYTLEPAPEIKAIDVLQVGTMVRMPGVIGGLRVEEIDRKGDRVICVDGCKERHTYKGLDYFTATAEEICIPEWLRICQYFYIGPKGVERNRVLCTDIIPCSDQEKPVVIVYSDHEGKERKIFLSPGLDSVNRTDRERLTAKYREQIVNNMQLGCGCMVGDGYEGRKDSKWVKVRKAYTNDSLSPRDWTYCVSWYDVEPTDGDGYRETLRECENGVTLEQAARALAQFEQENSEQADTLTEEQKRDTLYRLWDAAWEKAQDEPKELRVIVETNEADPSAPKNEFGRYYMIDKADGCGNVYDRWQVIRVDIVKSPYEVHRPNYAAANGYADDQAQICIEVENKNNIVRWAHRMIDAGRVTDIYADCY
jgi:hypothetical protein